MDIHPRTLFNIAGKDGPARRRVTEAMEWLLSPEADGIGEQLLRDAYALHRKALTIAVSAKGENGYSDEMGEHTIRIDPQELSIPATDGTPHIMSVERRLGHEMKHAGQKRTDCGVTEIVLLEHQIGTTLQSHLAPGQQAAQQKYLDDAMEAPDYDTARKHLETYVDHVALPLQKAIDRELSAHPDYKRHIQEFEMPAMEVENRIAVLRGEPIRSEHMSSHRIAPEKRREMILDDLSNVMELQHKPRLAVKATQRTDGKPWAESVSDRSSRKLS